MTVDKQIKNEKSLANRLRGCDMQLKKQNYKCFSKDLGEAADIIKKIENTAPAKVICVIRRGNLTEVFSNNPNVSVELLDYDNLSVAEMDSEEYQSYTDLIVELKTGKYHQIW